MDALRDLLEKIIILPADFWEDLGSEVTEKILPRKTMLIKQGRICKEIFFIVKGLARAFYFKNDTDITSRFMRENELITVLDKTSSHENIELMEESILITLSVEHFSSLQKKYPEFNFATRVLTEREYILSEERAYAMRMKSARERYEELLDRDLQIFQRIPLKHIASYLGMKAETLSRIRARVR